MIRPLEYSNAPLQMMSALANDMKQENALRQKKYQEEFNQGLELAQMISPEVLNKNFDAQVVNESIAGIRQNLKDFIKNNPNAGAGQIQNEVQKQIAGISDWSTKVKTIKSNLENTFKQIPQDKKVNKDRWMNAALTKALYKTNPDGTRTFRNAQELDPSFDYASDVWETGGEAFIDLSGVSKDIDDKIKNSGKRKENVTVTVGATKDKPGFKKTENVEIPTWGNWDEAAGKVVVKRNNGELDNDIYTAFVGGPNSEQDKFLNIKVKGAFGSGENIAGIKPQDVFNEDGSVKDKNLFEKAKKEWLAGYLQKFAPSAITNTSETKPARTEVIVNTGSGSGDVNFIDVVDEVTTYMKNNPRKEGMNWYPITAFSDVAQDAIIGKVRKTTGINSLGLKDIQIENKGGKPSIVIAEDIMDQNDPTKILYKKGQYISALGKQANMSANQPLGTKAKNAAVNNDKPATKKKYNPQTGKYE